MKKKRYTCSNIAGLGGINVPYCGKCGFQVNDEMQFCPNCGTPLKTQVPAPRKTILSKTSYTLPLYRMTPFVNGIFIGIGATLLVGGLFAAYALDGSY